MAIKGIFLAQAIRPHCLLAVEITRCRRAPLNIPAVLPTELIRRGNRTGSTFDAISIVKAEHAFSLWPIRLGLKVFQFFAIFVSPLFHDFGIRLRTRTRF